MNRIFLLLSFMCAFSSCIKDRVSSHDLKPGDCLPDFSVVMNDGSVLTDDILKGHVSIVMFFHTSCPDCQATLPSMQRIYDEYAPKGVVLALISREESSKDIEYHFEEKGLEMPYSAQNDRKVYELFAESGIPRIYVNDRNGIIRSVFTDDPVPSYADLKDAVESLIR